MARQSLCKRSVLTFAFGSFANLPSVEMECPTCRSISGAFLCDAEIFKATVKQVNDAGKFVATLIIAPWSKAGKPVDLWNRRARERRPRGRTWLPAQSQSCSTVPSPANGGPDSLVQVIPGDLGDELEPGNRAGDSDPAGQEPANNESVERPQHPPADGLDNRSGMRLHPTKKHPAMPPV